MVFFWRWQDGREDMIEYRLLPDHMTILYHGEEQEMILPAGYEAGLLLGSSGEHVVRLLPPYIVETADIDKAVSILDRIFA